jgi:hypothetical protein
MKKLRQFEEYMNNTFAPWVIMMVIGINISVFTMQVILTLAAYFGS